MADIAADNDQQLLFNQAFLLTESMLGEEVLDKWIGVIEITAEADIAKSPEPIRLLQERVSEKISEVKESLPDRPFFERSNDAEWTLYKLEPVKGDDYPGQKDLTVGKSMCDALDLALVEAKLGSCIGGGKGLIYSYIDLALINKERGISVIRKVLQDGNIGKRAWVLFYDSEKKSEWVGIWDDSPAPPMPDFLFSRSPDRLCAGEGIRSENQIRITGGSRKMVP